MTQHRITIIEPSGVRRTIPLTLRDVTIGRSSDSDIMLDYGKTSRNHAIIRPDGGRFYVIDLDSSNGTYMGRTRLPANSPQLWPPDKSISIGEVQIRLESVQSTMPRPEERDHMGTVIEASPFATPQKRSNVVPMLIIGLVLLGLCVIAFMAAGLGYYFLEF
jgi:predicted component of type VI protein secretion system